MNKIKKLCIVLLVLAVCATIGVSVWAADAVTFGATVNGGDTVCVSSEARDVTVTVAADKQIDMASFDATVLVPEGWTLKTLDFGTLPVGADAYEENRISWFDDELTNRATTNLVAIT